MIAIDPRESAPVMGDARDQAALRHLKDVLVEAEGDLNLVTPSGEVLPLPDSLRRLLTSATDVLARGEALTLVTLESELSTSQAAVMLGMSRPHLIKLLDQGDIPYRRVGSHRRIGLLDLYRYMAKRRERSRDLLAEMARIAEESAGGYD